MKKIFSLALMATALLISGQANAKSLQEQINEAPYGGASATVITLTEDVDLGSSNIAIFDRNIEIDLNGHSITSTQTAIFLLKGKLKLKGNGSVINNTATDSYEAIRVMGSAKPTDANYSTLIIAGNVSVSGNRGVHVYPLGLGYVPDSTYSDAVRTINGVGKVLKSNAANYIVNPQNAKLKADYEPMNLSQTDTATLLNKANNYQSIVFGSNHGYAFGVNVVVETVGTISGKQYGIQVSGTVRGMRTNADGQEIFTDSKKANWPKITINKGTVKGTSNNGLPFGGSYPTGIYAAGYADIVVEGGTVTGDNGIVVKGGTVDVKGDAVISATGVYTASTSATSGTKGSGSAINIVSDAAYSGKIEVKVSGSVQVTSTNGYAILEEKAINTTSENKTDSIVISGGTFKGAEDKAAVITTPEVKQQISQNGTITGGTYSSEDISTYLPAVSGLITIEVNENNEPVYVIGGSKTPVDWKNESLNDVADGAYVQIKDKEYTCTLTKNVNIAYLSMADAEEDATVTIPAGKVLTVGEIVLGENAKIIVEAGGKLVVNGENGIIAFDADNLVLKAAVNAAKDTVTFGTFVLYPDVKGNKNPKATVEYIASKWTGKLTVPEGPTVYYWDIFTSPFKKIYTITNTKPSSFKVVENGVFVEKTKPQIIAMESCAFEMIAVTTNQGRDTVKYTMTGELQGATSLNFPVSTGFIYKGNAYTAKMNAKEMVQELQQNEGGVRKLVYLWNAKNNSWEAKNKYKLDKLGDLNAMSPFVLYSDSESNVNLNYKKLVWDANNK